MGILQFVYEMESCIELIYSFILTSLCMMVAIVQFSMAQNDIRSLQAS